MFSGFEAHTEKTLQAYREALPIFSQSIKASAT